MLCPRRRPQLSESMTDMVRRAPDSQGRPGKKPPRDPKRLRAKLKKARSKLLFETACKSARSLVTPADRSAVGEPFLTHVPHDRPSAYSWADDRALHEANSLGVYSLEETSGQTGQSHPAQPARQLDFTPFPEPEAPPIFASPDTISEVIAALDRDLTRRRSYRLKQVKEEGNGAPLLPDGQSALRSSSHRGSLHDRARQLRNRYKRETAPALDSENIDPLEFALWLHSLKPFWKPASWRLYRKAGLAMIQALPHENLDAAVAMLSEDGRRRLTQARKVDRRRLANESGISQTRADRITHCDYQRLLDGLPKISSAAAVGWLRGWLVAGVSTGILPSEWPLVELEERQLGADKRQILANVINPAQGHDQGHPSYRTLDISNYRPDTVDAIKCLIANSRKWAREGIIQRRRSECTQLLYHACEKLFSDRKIKFSLFTFRHQFIANMKSITSRAEVIAMAGAVDIDYKSEHYAKSRAAWNISEIRDVPAPTEEQVKRVRTYLELVEDRETVVRHIARRRARK
jgi:hypothetical protein